MPVQSAHNFSQRDLLLITTDPVRYMAKLQGMSGPLLNSCLGPFLRTCLSEHWPQIRDAGIINLIEKASSCEGLASMIYALDAYMTCLQYMTCGVDDDLETERKNAKDTIAASKNISLDAWATVKEIYNGSAGAGQRELFRSATQQVLEHLSLFRDYNNKTSNPVSTNNNDLLHSSRWHCLALYSWLHAPDGKSRRDSDTTRIKLSNTNTREGRTQEVQLYIKETPPARVLSQLRLIIKSQDATEASLTFSLHLLQSTLVMYYPSTTPWDGLEADICQVMWTIMRFGTITDRRLATARTGNLLILTISKDPLATKGPRAFRILHDIFKDHNGARLMARVAILEAKERKTSDRPLFLIDHVLDMLKTEAPPQSDGCRNLISIIRDTLDPIWLQTYQHLCLLESEHEPQAKALVEKWHSLGKAVKVRAFTNPLIGCSWFMCSLYEEPSAKKMMLWKICHEVQYCNTRCQRGDWKAGHKERCRLINS